MLFIFDLDGTLIENYMDVPLSQRDFNAVNFLPGRLEKITQLLQAGHRIGIATNQRGVAFGYNTLDQLGTKMAKVYGAITGNSDAWRGRVDIRLCCSDTRAKNPQFNSVADSARAKPSPAMIEELKLRFPESASEGVQFIGDRDEDAMAARAAGVVYVDAEQFFRPENV